MPKSWTCVDSDLRDLNVKNWQAEKKNCNSDHKELVSLMQRALLQITKEKDQHHYKS